MGCEICGRNNCCASFHSLEEQQNFDEIAENVKDRMSRILINKIERLNGHYHGDNYYIKSEDVIKIVDDYS